MEYLWHLETFMDESEKDWGQEQGTQGLAWSSKDTYMVHNTDDWFISHVQQRALYLWRGGQVDGTYFEWYAEAEVLGRGYLDVLERPEAVMAGFRYLTSLKSTPRSLRAPMHSSLFNKGLYM